MSMNRLRNLTATIVNASLDHVIVGSGAAGFLISVAVITAGGFYEADGGNISVVPAYDVFYFGTDANDKILLVDLGSTVAAIQMWSDQVSNSSYSLANLLRLYKKSVQYTPRSILYMNSSNVQTNGAFDRSGGPLPVSFSTKVWMKHTISSHNSDRPVFAPSAQGSFENRFVGLMSSMHQLTWILTLK
ncbi:MAG: hypothetical protein Q9175_002518 [Cornicularia normoerica]